ncbi:MAG: BamA/TamA family outer membrane protein [FCB group bacterium]|nr:BamA/TamA family outer membrane protein [FCB group bacterium]
MKIVLSIIILNLMWGLPQGAESPDSSFSLTITDTIVVEQNSFIPRDFRPQKRFFPKKIGLALSGGGARGISQIGVLKAFTEAGLDFACIAGTSMGSVIGGLSASGYNPTDIEEMIAQVDFTSLFSDTPHRRSLLLSQKTERDKYLVSIRFDGLQPYIPRALTAGQRLTTYLADLTIRANYGCGGNFDRLLIPYRAVATDIGTGEIVSIARGNLADAMRASMGFPLAFTAMELDGHHLMDGGILNPLPVDICRDLGADFVVAVNTVSTLLPVEHINDPVDIANQVTTIMSQEALALQLANADLVITPALENLESFDFKMRDTLIAIGYQAGQNAIDELVRKLGNFKAADPVRLTALEITDNREALLEIRDNFPIPVGNVFDLNDLRQALIFSDQKKIFSRLRAEIKRRGSEVGICIGGELNVPANDVKYQLIGNGTVPDSTLIALLPHQTNKAVSLSRVKEAVDGIIDLYHRSGYDLAYLHSIKYRPEAGEVIITLDEGLLRFVDIRGNQRTRDWIIKANYPLRPGQPFDVKKSETGLANIFGTGFFERVSLDVEPTKDGAHVTINVKEKKFFQIRLGSHWDDEYQAEMFVEIMDDNILGAGIQALTRARLSSRRNRFELMFQADRLSKTFIIAGSGVYFSRLKRRLFQPDGSPGGFRVEDRLGWKIFVGQQIARLGTITFEYRVEDIRTELTIPDLEDNHVFSAFAIRSSVETFDRFPFPNRGHRQDMEAEFTSKWLGGTFDEYTKLSGSIEAYWPLSNIINLHPKMSVGVSTADLPEIEKYYIGGLYQFSGYRTEQLLGDKYFATNLQLRFKLPWRFYLLGNFDWGNIFNEYEDIRIKDFRRGYGAAIAIDTPFGPIDFGYGKAETAPYRLYLNVGLKF